MRLYRSCAQVRRAPSLLTATRLRQPPGFSLCLFESLKQTSLVQFAKKVCTAYARKCLRQSKNYECRESTRIHKFRNFRPIGPPPGILHSANMRSRLPPILSLVTIIHGMTWSKIRMPGDLDQFFIKKRRFLAPSHVTPD